MTTMFYKDYTPNMIFTGQLCTNDWILMGSYLEDLLEGVDQLGTHTVAGNQCAGGPVGAVAILKDGRYSGYI